MTAPPPSHTATDAPPTIPPAIPPRQRRAESRVGSHDASALFAALRAAAAGSAEHRRARDELVHRHMALVQFLTRRFRHRGESPADLVQVATIGLIKAIDRFDPTREVEFTTFATPTIIGELKRHFRDRASTIRVPRRLQEQQASLSRASTELFQRLGRSPTVAELSAATGLTEEQALDCLECAHAYSTVSLDAVVTSPSGESSAVYDAIRTTDEALEEVERREALRPLLDQLPERERRIVVLRFFRGMTQSEIAAEIGISQMHVSRLLTRTLSLLRAGLAD
jgi:RNA polymerase sigma-B factor